MIFEINYFLFISHVLSAITMSAISVIGPNLKYKRTCWKMVSDINMVNVIDEGHDSYRSHEDIPTMESDKIPERLFYRKHKRWQHYQPMIIVIPRTLGHSRWSHYLGLIMDVIWKCHFIIHNTDEFNTMIKSHFTKARILLWYWSIFRLYFGFFFM